MDIATQVEIVLRGAGYETWRSTDDSSDVTCFENAALIGFVHVFPSAEQLLQGWESAQHQVLARYGAALRAAGTKAWNVYSVFLAEEPALAPQRAIGRIEENFSLTRKIARVGVRTRTDVERALLALTAIKAQPILSDADFRERLLVRLKQVPSEALTAFLDGVPADDVAKILADKS